MRAAEYFENFNCPPHVLWEHVWVMILCCGADVAEKLSEPPRFGAEVPQPTQCYQNHKSILAETSAKGVETYLSILLLCDFYNYY